MAASQRHLAIQFITTTVWNQTPLNIKHSKYIYTSKSTFKTFLQNNTNL